jgi:hypothetical protein
MADEQEASPERAPEDPRFAYIEFHLWDGSSLFFTERVAPYTVEVHDGIVVVFQGDEEIGIPTSSLRYSAEHTPSDKQESNG